LKKIATIIGARPQFIKAATISRLLLKEDNLREIIIHTGQHFDSNMSTVFFQEMEIPEPDFNLEISMLSHGAMTGRMIEKIEAILIAEKPNLVLVYGDTNSTLAGALAARKLNIPIAHVEAGLRSFNMKMPEEINRILTDRISDLLFCPTENAIQNLQKEGFENFDCKIYNVGDVMYDAALYYGSRSSDRSDILSKLRVRDKNFILCSVHRQENTDDITRLKSIIEALNDIHRETTVILPLHPRTRKILAQNSIDTLFDPIEPVGYYDIVELLKHSGLVITDSGGMQKEAYFFRKYCITLREETEWVELVENNYNVLAGSDPVLIKKGVGRFLGKEITDSQGLYGNGDASQLIVNTLKNKV
jgi:UDP-GlcNAc3NAcA epimerase